MGFVFDIKKWVFSNENLIKKTIDESQILKEFNLQNYTKLL